VPDYADARSNHTWQVIGLLRPGVTVRTASDQVRAVAQAISSAEGVDERDQGMEAIAVRLRASTGGERVGALFALLGAAVFLVLFTACMNASGLLLTRAWSRTRELSLRAALGAKRGRLVWILLGETAVLAPLGGGVGVVLGHVGLQRLLQVAPPEIARLSEIQLNPSVLTVGPRGHPAGRAHGRPHSGATRLAHLGGRVPEGGEWTGQSRSQWHAP